MALPEHQHNSFTNTILSHATFCVGVDKT